MNAALQANLCRAALPRLADAAREFSRVKVIWSAAQRSVPAALGKRAELASVSANISVIDVAIDDVVHDLAVDLATQRIGRITHGSHVLAARFKQLDDLVFGEPCSGQGFPQGRSDPLRDFFCRSDVADGRYM